VTGAAAGTAADGYGECSRTTGIGSIRAAGAVVAASALVRRRRWLYWYWLRRLLYALVPWRVRLH